MIHWSNVVGIPEGARVQNDARAKAAMVYFPYYFRDENGKAKAERDYIGTVVDGKFCPNAYYRENLPVHKRRPPERWRDARQRAKAEALEKAVAHYLSSTDWFDLELDSKDDITRQIGATALCARILYDEHIVEEVARTLNFNVADTMHALNLALHLALTSKASYLAKSESEVCKFIGSGCLSSQRISEFFMRIGKTLQLSSQLSKWRSERMTKPGDLISVDGTFLDCNSQKIAAAAHGKRKDGTYGPQINFAMVSNATTGVPIGYRWYSGDTHDVKTLDDLKALWSDYGVNEKGLEFVWDRGYFDSARMAEFAKGNFKFISGAQVGLNIVKDVIEKRNDEFYSASSQLKDHYCFGVIENVTLADGVKAKAYVYFSPNRQMAETRKLRDELEKIQKDWISGKLTKINPTMASFFKSVKAGKPLEINEFAFDQECFARGFFACVSNTTQSLDELLHKYRMRNEIEVLFRLMIGRLLDTTRVQSSAALEGLLFVVFIALSILGRLRQALKTEVPPHKNVRAANCEIIDFDKTYTVDDYITISEALHELREITATVSKKSGAVRLTNLTEKKIRLVKDLGMGTLFESAEEVWKLMSAKHLSDVIATVREADGVKG